MSSSLPVAPVHAKKGTEMCCRHRQLSIPLAYLLVDGGALLKVVPIILLPAIKQPPQRNDAVECSQLTENL